MPKLIRFLTFFANILIILIIFINPYSANAKEYCSKKDHEYADFWRNYYDPEDARKFGIKIQNLVRERNLPGIFSLVDGELENGPRKRFVANRSFDEIFDENWRTSILETDAPCSPVGWRGFMLGNGLIWFNKREENSWHIFGINDAAKENYKSTVPDTAWRIGEKVLLPQCFVKQWISSDNFEAFEESFGIKDKSEFRIYTGRYFGREINSIEPIDAPWGGGKVNLAGILDDCSATQLSLTRNSTDTISIDVDGVSFNRCDKGGNCTEEAYRLLSPVSREACQDLAPYLLGHCEVAHLVKIGDYSGGSMGWDYGYNIYGLFTLRDGRKAIIPLVNFFKENDARNFIDRLNTKYSGK